MQAWKPALRQPYLHQVLGPDAMFGFQSDGKVPENLNEARPNGFALHLRILLALQSTRLLLHTIKQQGTTAARQVKADCCELVPIKREPHLCV